ncbi:hypothetical protein ACF08N_15900 [Streptomyces sp. NPDC015127]|uniref:hypothetical protein n=1 Tax=Streptomyces sp. NPDC015127 TaxID=3364939 RepID=UPI0036FE1A0F
MLTSTLDVMAAPNTPPMERAAYGTIVDGIIKTLETAENPQTPPMERATFRSIAQGMTEAVENAPNLLPDERAQFLDHVQWTMKAVTALQHPTARPRDPKDRFKIQQTVEETSNALARIHDRRATPEERSEAKRKLDQRTASLRNPEYLEFIEEVKRRKAPAACVDTINNRTREVGWREGSLWGLSDSACGTTVAEAAQSGGRWSALFECVQQEPFSTCGVYVPRD